MKHTHKLEGQLCLLSHYVSLVDAQKEVEVYQRGDVDCPDCLRRMAEKHEALAATFRSRLDTLKAEPRRCRAYVALCLNPPYCDARDACCAGDPACHTEIA